MRMLALLAGSKNHSSLPLFSISLLASRGGATKRIRLWYCPRCVSAFDSTNSVLLSVCLPLRYSISVTTTPNGFAGLRTSSLAARIACASGAARTGTTAATHAASAAPRTKRDRLMRHRGSDMAQRIHDVHARRARGRQDRRQGRHHDEPGGAREHHPMLAANMPSVWP